MWQQQEVQYWHQFQPIEFGFELRQKPRELSFGFCRLACLFYGKQKCQLRSGCFVNYPTQWLQQPDYPKNNELALTDKEKECLKLLAESWKIFVELDDSEFCTALHAVQKMIALLVARRIDKDVWSQHD